ncbi:MAG: bifunctional phosphoribosyl-AMP cyclohydrolase/phosphoribosyl-ATP diphosphatase HisIE [Blautia sp.]|nr:bifunctional phosphoribosyl-AMP cyclohydrolase/phosphoribosyl-ATP diphosphatase HisIE [Blautia sp.]MDY4515433.1 bifunctional phosphoribosyl-AMP cyclohydrolase/phosphoribosyl-ATP diphosphatase HisIE [Lachnospiraceae bacterium]
MSTKKLAPYIFIKNGKAVKGFSNYTLFEGGDVLKLAQYYSNNGADELIIFDLSDDDASHEESLLLIKEMSRKIDIPMAGGGNVRRLEDVKKLIYAGCRKAFLNFSKKDNVELLEEVSRRFGKEKLAVCADNLSELRTNRALIEEYAGEVLLLADEVHVSEACKAVNVPVMPVVMRPDVDGVLNLLGMENVSGVCARAITEMNADLMELKLRAKEREIPVNTFESSMQWSELKKNENNLIPVIVQDYKTMEVLMMAYMNREAFETTVKTGKMTYWSRSRNELWVKGMTSGHFQYVRQLSIDCDNDTILAKVLQVGAACHTGNRSCFYRELVKKDFDETNPMKVFENVYAVIMDRKEHPKEGSYTNYLFDKGIDKILKKVGEEATEIVIAAKNPNPEEIKYEISDFLYHVMVLMAEKGVTWEDITKELAQR